MFERLIILMDHYATLISKSFVCNLIQYTVIHFWA